MEKIFNKFSIIFGIVGGFIAEFLGGFDGYIITILTLIVIDYITGIMKAIYKKEISSEIGHKGIIKKVAMLLVIGVSFMLEKNIGISSIRNIVIMFFIGNEGISILENVAEMDVKIPEKLKDILFQLRDSSSSEGDEKKDE